MKDMKKLEKELDEWGKTIIPRLDKELEDLLKELDGEPLTLEGLEEITLPDINIDLPELEFPETDFGLDPFSFETDALDLQDPLGDTMTDPF